MLRSSRLSTSRPSRSGRSIFYIGGRALLRRRQRRPVQPPCRWRRRGWTRRPIRGRRGGRSRRAAAAAAVVVVADELVTRPVRGRALHQRLTLTSLRRTSRSCFSTDDGWSVVVVVAFELLCGDADGLEGRPGEGAAYGAPHVPNQPGNPIDRILGK